MEYKKFGEFINSTQYGYTANETSQTEGNAKYLRITDIVPYFVNKDTVPFCEISENKKNKYLVKEGDLLIARTGATTGYNLVIDDSFENYIFASYLIRFNLNKDIVYPRYVKYVLKSNAYYGFVNNYIGGSAQPGMNAKAFEKFDFPYVEYDTQIKISNILSKFDELIKNNNKRISILERMAEKVYEEWFVKFRFPEYKNYCFIDAKPYGWICGNKSNMSIPSNWHFGRLDEIGKFVRGKNITSTEMQEGEIPVVSAGIEPSGYHNEANVKGKSLTMSASGANAGYLKYNLNDIWAADCSYYQNDENIWFVYSSLKFIESAIKNLQVGSAQPHVYAKNINKLNIIIPEEKYIKMYNDFVNPMFEEIRTLNEKNIILVKQRDLLLPRLMSGKLEVK